jgi:hypothetical protein
MKAVHIWIAPADERVACRPATQFRMLWITLSRSAQRVFLEDER